MRHLLSFIRKNWFWIVLVLALEGMHLFYLYLVQASWYDIWYSALLDAALITVTAICAFLNSCKRLRQLKQLADEPVSGEMVLPEPLDELEELYGQLFENANIARQLATSSVEKQQRDMKEYYARWVHQIKTPIAAMQLILQMQRNTIEEMEWEDEKQYMERVQAVSDLEEELFRIEQYVSMALQYQRVNDGSDYVIEELALDRIVREAIRKYAKVMIRKKLTVSYSGTERKVITDEKWLAFVIEQLISNAVKYSTQGTVQIDVVDETNWSYLRIRDQGIGIQKEDIPRIFEQGYTGYNGHADKRSTGIGLYLCRQVLTKLGHTIRIESEVGKGTTVWVGFSTKKRDHRD